MTRDPASWIIVRLSDNQAVMETYERSTMQAINTQAYKAVPVLEYLYSLNRRTQ